MPARAPVLARQHPLEALLGAGFDPASVARDRTALETAVAKSPASHEAWIALLEWSYLHEEADETVARARRGIEQVPEPADLWRMIVRVRLADARSGPIMLTRPNVTRTRAQRLQMPAEDFSRGMLQQALAALEQVLALEPGDREARAQLGFTLMQLERWSAAEAHWTSMLETEWTAQAAAARAFSRAHAGQPHEALAEIASALERAPRSSDLHGSHAKILEMCGAPSEASADALARARFYGRLLPDSTLGYSADAASSLDRLHATKAGQPSLFSGDRDTPVIQAEITALEERGDRDATELLAALAWGHTVHGRLEDQVFDHLAERGHVVVLQRILAYAQTPCTAGNALRALVTLKVDVFETLARLLPQDGGLFPMRILAQLDRLADPRTGDVLIAYTRDDKGAFFEDALVVLGRFPSDEARRHLESWLKHRTAGPFAATGLYQMQPDKRLWRAMEKALTRGEVWDVQAIAATVRKMETPEARKLIERYDARVKKERAKASR